MFAILKTFVFHMHVFIAEKFFKKQYHLSSKSQSLKCFNISVPGCWLWHICIDRISPQLILCRVRSLYKETGTYMMLLMDLQQTLISSCQNVLMNAIFHRPRHLELKSVSAECVRYELFCDIQVKIYIKILTWLINRLYYLKKKHRHGK